MNAARSLADSCVQCDVCHASCFGCERTARGQVECRHCKARLDRGKPAVGEGATYYIGSDAYSYTVVKVSASGKTIWLTPDKTRATKAHDYYGQQSYVFEPDLYGKAEKATLRKDGYYRFVRSRCGSIQIGERHAHRDPHF
jgi:hypothetical protein